MANMWDEQADFYSSFAFSELDDTSVYLDEFGVKEGDSVLDVCCGPGRISVVAAARGARVTGIDSSPNMLEHARANAKSAGVEDRTTFQLIDWKNVLPGQNVEAHDVVIASRCGAMMDVEKLSTLANRTVGVQIFADAPSLPQLLDVIFDGCGVPDAPDAGADQPFAGHGGPGRPGGPGGSGGPGGPRPGGPGRPGPGGPGDLGIYLSIAAKAHAAGFDPNVRILPERFRKVCPTKDEVLAWACALNPERSQGFEERVAQNIAPFLRETDAGIEFCIATAAALIWWDVRGPARWTLARR